MGCVTGTAQRPELRRRLLLTTSLKRSFSLATNRSECVRDEPSMNVHSILRPKRHRAKARPVSVRFLGRHRSCPSKGSRQMRPSIPVFLFTSLFLVGCANSPIGPENALEQLLTSSIPAPATVRHGFVPGLPPGYQCPLIPNGFDPVGSIYRIDAKGTYFRVTDFSNDPSVLNRRRTVAIANYALSDEQVASTSLSANLMKNVLPGLAAQASSDTSSKIAVGITVKDLKGEIIDDQVADYVIAWFRRNVSPRPGSRYYLVREAIKAGAVSYSLEDKDVQKLGGKAQIIDIADAKADVTVRDELGRLVIEQTFAKRISVCTKPSEIVLTRSLAVAGDRLQKEQPQPVIKAVGRAE